MSPEQKKRLKEPCSKCGGSAPKVIRKKLRKSGKRTVSVATFCRLCHAEDQKCREAKPSTYAKKLAYNRAYKKKNRKKVNGWERKWYWGRKMKQGIVLDSAKDMLDNLGAEFGENYRTEADFAPSKMKYVDLYVHGGR